MIRQKVGWHVSPQSATAQYHTKPFAQWNLILVHLQHSITLEKQENKEKLFEINV